MSKSVCRVHYIQHVSYEGIGYIGEWIKGNGSQLSVTKMYDGQTKGKYIQSKADIFSGFCNIPVSNQMMKTILDNLTKRR